MSVLNRRLCAVGLVLAGVGVGGPAAAPAQETTAVDGGAVKQIAQDYFALRTAAVVTQPGAADASAPAVGSLPATPAFVDRLTGDLDVLAGRRATLAGLQERYTAASTEVEVGAVRATADGAVAEVTETTTLTYARIRGDEPPVTAYELEHTLTYRRDGSKLVLASDEVPSEGLLPITAVSSAATGSPFGAPRAELEAPAAADPLPHGSAGECGQAGACDATDEAAADMTVADSNTTATPSPVTSKPNPSVPDQDFELVPPMNRSGAAPAGMNYGAVINYAYRHWNNYNGAYRSFGNDCTNFVSQALRAGGWPMDYGWYRGDGNWWYNSSNQTYTWAGAENWSRFAPKRTTYLGNTYQLLPSDVMVMDFNRDNSMDHAMVVTKKTSSMPYFTYHTNNTLDRSMQSIYSQYSSSWYYAYRT